MKWEAHSEALIKRYEESNTPYFINFTAAWCLTCQVNKKTTFSNTEVHQLFEDTFSIELISHTSGPDIVGNLADRGLDTLTEKVYVMKRKPG